MGVARERLKELLGGETLSLDGAVRLGRQILFSSHDALYNDYDNVKKYGALLKAKKLTNYQLQKAVECVWALQRDERWYLRPSDMFKMLAKDMDGSVVVNQIKKEADWRDKDYKLCTLIEKEFRKHNKVEIKREKSFRVVDPKEKEIITQCSKGQLTVEESAEKLNITIRQVRSRVWYLTHHGIKPKKIATEQEIKQVIEQYLNGEFNAKLGAKMLGMCIKTFNKRVLYYGEVKNAN